MALKSIQTLIKLHKRKVDSLRREMVTLEEERRQLIELSEKLAAEHKRELQLSVTEPKVASFFGAYSKRVKLTQERLAREVKRLDGAIDEKAEAIRAEFSEQKKYEIVNDNAKKRLIQKQLSREQQRFDEVGSQQFLRAEEGN